MHCCTVAARDSVDVTGTRGTRGARSRVAVRCVQEEAAARIEAAIEAARDAFEKQRTKGKKGKGTERAPHGLQKARKCGACLFGSLRRLIAAMLRRRAAVGACDRSIADDRFGVRRQWRLRWI